MTSIFADGALHPGRDANDSSWLTLRDAHAWAGASLTDVVHSTGGFSLAPRAFDGDVSLTTEVVAADGTRFRADPDLDRVMRRRPCDTEWTVLVGGRGTETGRLRRPSGLALDNRRGLLAIADSGNHRVQIVRADGGEIVIVLGCLDTWGRGVAPSATTGPHALAEPVAVTFGAGRLVIADRTAGTVHIYDDRFRFTRAFKAHPRAAGAGFVAAPIAIAFGGAVLWIVDAGWSTPVAYSCDGEPITDAGPVPESLTSWLVRARFAPRGEIVHGPIDGRTEGLAWHRVILDAATPAGASCTVQTFASDELLPPSAIPWAPVRPVHIPLAGVEGSDGETSRPVLSDHGRWERKRGEPYVRTSRAIVRLAGTGPINAAAFTIPWSAARRLRVLDEISLTPSAGASVTRPISGITPRVVHGVIRGDLQAYQSGSRLTLLERDAEVALDAPRQLTELGTGDLIDASLAVDDGTIYELPASHSMAALLRAGDVIRIDDPLAGTTATLVVHAIDHVDATIVLAAAVAGDFSISDLRIVVASGRLIVDALGWTDGVPPGEPVFVHDDVSPPVVATIRWVEPELHAVWLEPGPVVPWSTWTRFELADGVATDRGRYLWLRLQLFGAITHPGDGASTASPVVRSVRLLLPRASYLRSLPAIYGRRDDDDPSGALFLERMLALPEQRLTSIEARYEDVARQLNPLGSSPEWLAFLATWFGLVLDPSWPPARRRLLLVSAHELFAKRGTLDGMRQYLEIYTGNTPAIIEGFQYRVNASPASVLGGKTVVGRAALGDVADHGQESRLAHTFSIWVFGDDGVCATDITAKAARAIIDSVKPAHTTYELHVVDSAPRVGISTTLGVDTVLIGGELPPSPIGLTPQPPHVLGRIHLPAPRHASATPTLGPIPIDHDFTLS